MAEEFVEFMEKLKREPIEEQLSKLKQVVSKMVVIIEKFIYNYDMELNKLYNMVTSVETKILKSELSKVEILSVSSPFPPLEQRPIGDMNVRGAIMKEIKTLFKKNEESDQNNDNKKM